MHLSQRTFIMLSEREAKETWKHLQSVQSSDPIWIEFKANWRKCIYINSGIELEGD